MTAIHFPPLTTSLPSVSYYTHAAFPFPIGKLQPANVDLVRLTENGKPIARGVEVASLWPDNSVQWLHVYAVYRWVKGDWLDYEIELIRFTSNGLRVPTSTAPVQDGPALVATSKLYWPTGPIEHTWRATFTKDMRTEQWQAQIIQLAMTSTSPPTAGDTGPGWIAATWKNDCVVALWRNMQHLGPKRFVHLSNGLGADMWPGGDRPVPSVQPLDTWQLGWLHRRPYVQLSLDDETRAVLNAHAAEIVGGGDNHPSTLDNATGIGVSMHHEILVVRVPRYIDAGLSSFDAFDLAPLWNEVYQSNPIGLLASEYVDSTGAMGGPFPGRSADFPQLESLAHDALHGHCAASERWGATGEFAWGRTPEKELPAEGRPSLHRASSPLQHYFGAATLWRQFLRDRDPATLALARRQTRYLACVGQCRYGPSTGQFWHGKSILPWLDQATFGHQPDPEGLRLAWVIDGNRFAREGFEAWKQAAKAQIGGIAGLKAREAQGTIHALVSSGDPALVAAGKNLAERQSQLGPITDRVHRPGPSWHPLCWTKAVEEGATLGSDSTEWLTGISQLAISEEGSSLLAIAAHVYRETGDKKILLRAGGWLADQIRRIARNRGDRWDGYGLPPGALGEGHFSMTWPYFLSALKAAGITEDELIGLI